MPRPGEAASRLINSWYRAALQSVEPTAVVRDHLQCDEQRITVAGETVPVTGRLVMLAVGKAAVAMARGAESVCGDRIADGLVITKEHHATSPLPSRSRTIEAGHPIPDERGVRATREALALANGLVVGDALLALISGGGSALLEAPRPPVTLDDLAVTTELLLRAGAPIQDLNAVRTPLSLVKAGGLRRAAGAAHVLTLILSDVLGNDPGVIASGPTVDGAVDPGQARTVLERYGIYDQVPAPVRETLDSLHDEPLEPPVEPPRDAVAIVGDNGQAVAAAREAAENAGFSTTIAWRDKTGEAAILGREWVELARGMPAATDVVVGGGEATVTVRGDGIGGRNTEFALAAAIALTQQPYERWIVASLATDGDDGPTRVAGAIAGPETLKRARAKGIDPAACLADNDSLRVFEAAGGVVRPGPTGTNVNDLYIAIREEALGRGR